MQLRPQGRRGRSRISSRGTTEVTAEPIDIPTRTVTGELPVRKAPAVEKAKLPLVWKLFGLTALLIVIVVGIAIGITIQRANTIARTTVDKSIASAAKLFKELERQRLGRLSLSAEFLGRDPSFVAYMEHAMSGTVDVPAATPVAGAPAETKPPAASQSVPPAAPATAAAAPSIDFADILDQLNQQKESLHSDLMIVLDGQGRVLSRTDRPALSGDKMEDLYASTPLVKQLVDDASINVVTGVITTGGHLYHAAMAPMILGANNVRKCYLINAYAIDDVFANLIDESTNYGVYSAPYDVYTPPDRSK